MAQTYHFPVASSRHPRTSKPPNRQIADKFQEIALRSPRDFAAFEHLADSVLERLNDEDRQKPH